MSEDQNTQIPQEEGAGITISGGSEPEKTSLYSSDDPSNKQVDLKKVGFELDIPQNGDAQAVAPEAEENVVDSIVKQATVDKTEEDRILQELETMDFSSDMDVPVAPTQSGAKAAKVIFAVILVVSLLTVGYFYTNKKGVPLVGIEANTSLSIAQQNLVDVKIQAVSQNLQVAAIRLRELGYLTSQLSAESQAIASGVETASARRSISLLRPEIKEVLSSFNSHIHAVKTVVKESDSVSEKLLLKLNDKQKADKELIKNTKEEYKKADLEFDAEIIKESAKIASLISKDAKGLVTEGSKPITEISKINVDDLTDAELLSKLIAMLKEAQVNDYAKIAYVQENRVRWSEVIAEIENVTKTVDPNFNFDGNINGDGISYSAFTFNSDTNRVSVTGQTRTSDIKTFTLIANLNDALEASEKFMDLDTRTFSKQEDEDFGYKSSIRMDMTLNSENI